MVRRMEVPPSRAYQTSVYRGLKGADFSQDPSLVSRDRSPDLLNMVSDNGGIPVKRKGYEKVKELLGTVHNLWAFQWDSYDVFCYVSGHYLTVCCGSKTAYQSLHSSSKKLGFYSQAPTNRGFYLMEKDHYYKVTIDDNGTPHVTNVSPYVPLVVISRNYDGGGKMYENINVLTRERKEQFLNDQHKNTFLVTSEVDTSKPYKFEYKNSNGDWVVDSTATVNGATFSVNYTHNPVVTGEDNISITYYATGTGDPDIDKSNMVLECTNHTHYSKSTIDQIFTTGNPAFPQHVMYSALGDPTYFPDLNYLFVGGMSTAVKGFMNIGDNLAVVKEESGTDSTVFIVYQTSISTKSVTIDDKTTKTTKEMVFACKSSTTGIGAIAKDSFGILNDEPLFLSRKGVYGIVPTAFGSEKVVRNRSFFLDSKLTRENNLDEAKAVVWNNYYLLSINGKVYVLDGRKKANDYKRNTDYIYEAYYWDNIPATCWLVYKNELYFGTITGDVMKFKNTGGLEDYNDNGQPIHAVWSTPNDNDGATKYLKTMEKKGTMLSFQPYGRTSVVVSASIDGYPKEEIATARADNEFGFAYFSFEPLRFVGNQQVIRDKVIKKKIKKYKRLKFYFENKELNEPFGIIEFVKTYTVNRFAKE